MPAKHPTAEPLADHVVRTVLCIDVVESVRLIEDNEEDTVRRWRSLVDSVAKNILPGFGGRLVKSLGDGMLIELPRVQPAISAAFAIQAACNDANTDIPAERRMLLRMGVHVTSLIADELDVYGRGVNLAARLTTLAGPGEIVVSADVRDQLTPMLDADVEDLGECFLKHLNQPVRAYRVGPPGLSPVIAPGSGVAPALQPTIAVIPFTAQSSDPAHDVVGEVVADEVIAALSRTAHLHVISRLSTTVFRNRSASVREVCAHLKANFVLSGSYRSAGDRFTLVAELAEARGGRVVWAQTIKGSVTGIVSGDDPLVARIVAEVSTAIMARELSRAQTQPLPTLETHTLLMGAIALMHRGSAQDFERARSMLEIVIERAPRTAIPYAWLAKWHVLRFSQGQSTDQQGTAKLARDCTRRALDADGNCSLALAIDGFVHTNLLKQLDVALERYELALQSNPNDSLAWLLKGTMHAFKGEGQLALDHTRHAMLLSPLDPLRYFYETLAATAALSAGEYAHAAELAQRSLRSNRTHTSSLRALAIAQSRLGRIDEARQTVREIMIREPTLTATKYLQRSPAGAYRTGKDWADALHEAGLPQ
jgi:class 3 adenylate cyclase/TolB-like protein/Tfp pilus assembly protein PilF